MRALADQVRRAPFTAGYALLLLVTGCWLSWAAPHRVAQYEQAVSTNVANLEARPVQVLLLSLSATDAEYRWLFLVLVVAALWLCETWIGTRRTVAVYVGANIAVTLLVAVWIYHCVAIGAYDVGIRTATDFGVSYGLNTVAMLLVARPTRLWANLLALGAVLGWLLLQDPWGFADQSQFFGLGHILAATLGLGLAVGVLVRRRLIGVTPDGRRALR